ncbi:uncharacterized protein LOC127720911 [Mytilus californianus]|uniref:uncharacterized protein LOC127720911 n=1 Tax=Mytilus californianus TaxID=6549 RepID=UPI002245F2BB|nr:uncharacterized protein LOC127720911 [Mytilus californianus]
MPAPLNSYLLRSQDTIRPEARVHQQATETTASTSTASTSTAPTTSTVPVLSTDTTTTTSTVSTASAASTVSTASTASTASTPSTPAVVQVIREVSVNMPSGINLNNYDGKSSAAQWWGYFIRWTLIQKMCEQQQCNSFPFFMADGIPKQWFATLSETVQNSLQLLKDEFFKRFEKSQGLFDVNILQLKQGLNERVDEFMARLQGKTIGQDIPDNIKIGIAIQGFRGEIGKTVHNTFPKPTTLEQLRAIAENAEKSEQLVPASSITADTIAAILEAKMQEPLEEIRRLHTLINMARPNQPQQNKNRYNKPRQNYRQGTGNQQQHAFLPQQQYIPQQPVYNGQQYNQPMPAAVQNPYHQQQQQQQDDKSCQNCDNDQVAENESSDSETNSDNGDEPNNVIDDTFHEVEKLLNNRNTREI